MYFVRKNSTEFNESAIFQVSEIFFFGGGGGARACFGTDAFDINTFHRAILGQITRSTIVIHDSQSPIRL